MPKEATVPETTKTVLGTAPTRLPLAMSPQLHPERADLHAGIKCSQLTVLHGHPAVVTVQLLSQHDVPRPEASEKQTSIKFLSAAPYCHTKAFRRFFILPSVDFALRLSMQRARHFSPLHPSTRLKISSRLSWCTVMVSSICTP